MRRVWDSAGWFSNVRSRVVVILATLGFLLGLAFVATRFLITRGVGDFLALILAVACSLGAAFSLFLHDGTRSRIRLLAPGRRFRLLSEVLIEGQAFRKNLFGITTNPELDAAETAYEAWVERVEELLVERFPRHSGLFGQTPRGHTTFLGPPREPVDRLISLMDNRLLMLEEILKLERQ